jgi:hypothetical protein
MNEVKVLVGCTDLGKISLLLDADIHVQDLDGVSGTFVIHCQKFELVIKKKGEGCEQGTGQS